MKGSTPASSFGECCQRCRALGWQKCTYFTFTAAKVGRECSFQTAAATVARRSPGSLSGWPSGGPCPPQCRHVAGGVRGPHGANSQLCGATYAELSQLRANKSMVAGVERVLSQEMKLPSSVSDWSWVDALFMSMNAYSRLGNITGNVAYYEKQYANFHDSALAPADGLKTYGMWNASAGLFYRDSRFWGTDIYWGRGNAWAIGALVAAIDHGQHDPHRPAYMAIFQQHAAKLLSLVGKDGAWRPSLLNPAEYPLGETTATAGITYGLAFGLNQGLLTPRQEYVAVVGKAWGFLSTVALQEDGVVGFCQPGGGSPENNYNRTSTASFCVGEFLLAASQVASVAEFQSVPSPRLKSDDSGKPQRPSRCTSLWDQRVRRGGI